MPCQELTIKLKYAPLATFIITFLTFNGANPCTSQPQLTKIYCAHLSWHKPVWVLVSVPNGASDNTISNEFIFVMPYPDILQDVLPLVHCPIHTSLDWDGISFTKDGCQPNGHRLSMTSTQNCVGLSNYYGSS